MKAQALADHLAENPVDDEYEPLKNYFPDENVMCIDEVDYDEKPGWKLFFDGAANMKGVGIGAVLISKAGQHYPVHGDLIHSPPSEFHSMSAPWPFVAWGMDVIGPIEPAASNGHRFILVAINYFTKWVKNVIITDNVANLNSHLMKEVCQQFKIMHRNSTPYLPKENGAIEAANKNIKKILRKMVQGSRQWHEKLPFALLGYRTTIRTSVGATPYLLVYETEAVIPAEVEILSLRIVAESEIDDDEWVKTR
ncbi:uncharacterized protein [Nicotiana sylvestris]|uniref:uncharacterized protein n=1 Tax=Nicotiana sylvestris TaxID=4096 RepID=UPI00388C9D59